eukprot:g2323.t1
MNVEINSKSSPVLRTPFCTNKRRCCILLCCTSCLILLATALLITWYVILPADDPDYNLTPFLTIDETVFISSEQLEQYLNSETGATVLDARSRYHRVVERTKAGYGDSIPGSRSAPWTDFTRNGGRDELKPIHELQDLYQQRGVSNNRPVVIYGSWKEDWGEEGRIYWQLDYLNHTNVFILYGGIFGWNGTGRGVDGRGDFVARPVPERHITANKIVTALDDDEVVIVDARTEDEYGGSTPHGSPRGGHIPTAVSYDWRRVFESDGSGNLKSPRKLEREFVKLGVTRNVKVVLYCTSGVRAGFLYAVMKWSGMKSIANYPGSWWMWSQNASLPIENI